MSPPFRLEPRQLLPESLLRISESAVRSATRRVRPDAFLPAGVVLTQLERATTISFEQLRLAMAHPDERVPLRAIELLADQDRRALTAQWRAYIRAAALARGVADAEREGIVWGPLLDALSSVAQWPGEKAYATQLAMGGNFPLPVDPPAHRSAEAQADRLLDWLANAEEAELLALLDARSLEVQLRVARHAAKPTAAFVDACLRDNMLVDALAGNPHLAMSHVRRIADWILPRLTTPGASSAPVAAAALATLERTGHRVPPDLVDALIAFGSEPVRKKDDRAARHVALRAVLALRNSLAQGMLDQVAEQAACDERAATLLVRHPEAGTNVWQTVARITKSVAVQAQLLITPGAAADPVVRRHLAESRESGILIGVMRNAEPDEAAAIYANLLKRDLDAALAVIEQDPEAAARIQPTAVMPLLENEDREIRERAMGALANLGRGIRRSARV